MSLRLKNMQSFAKFLLRIASELIVAAFIVGCLAVIVWREWRGRAVTRESGAVGPVGNSANPKTPRR